MAAGIVESLARPGRNITGLRTYADGLWEKYVELVRELLPGLRTLGLLSDYVPPGFVAAETEYGAREMRAAAKALGVALPEWRVTGDADLRSALAEIEGVRPDALFVTGGPTHAQPRNIARLREFLLRRRLAMVNDIPGSVFRNAGGVMAYAVSFQEVAARTASFIDRILNGALPGELPIEQPTKIELVRKLPRNVDSLEVELSGTIEREGGSNEALEVYGTADHRGAQAG
ncbi:MAG TPA: ABC transporter substrate binding protein [Burkholderiales bacterium]|nr:ABC transporter substrate binding protein [Burkholderiales bacterium]